MLGRPTVELLKAEGAIVKEVFHIDYDLTSQSECTRLFNDFPNPTYLIHFAGFNGGINYNKKLPATIFERTVKMGVNVLAMAASHKVKKVVNLMTSCAYPPTEEPLKEEQFLTSEPHPSVRCHALAKRTLYIFSQLLEQQYGMRTVSVILNNSMGPFDSFDLEKTKVVGALIRKFVEAKRNKEPEVVVWGTGKARRELMYSKDAAKGIVEVLKHYEDTSLPINLGSSIDHTIASLAEKIKDVSGYTGKIVFDTTKPDGQMRKILDITRMQKYLPDYFPDTPIKVALKETVQWYEENFPHEKPI